jgi:hypothetical protein
LAQTVAHLDTLGVHDIAKTPRKRHIRPQE